MGSVGPVKLMSVNTHPKTPKASFSGWLCDNVAAAYSPGCNPSTIGAAGLNFSVRDGKRWDPCAGPPDLSVPGTKYDVPCIPGDSPPSGKISYVRSLYIVLGTLYIDS